MGREENTKGSEGNGREIGYPAARVEVLFAARWAVLCLCFLAANVPAAWGADSLEAVSGAIDPVGMAAPSGGSLTGLDPRITSDMSHKNREQLIVSFRVALDRVRDVPECGDLFSELGADGIETLNRVLFVPIGREEFRTKVCDGNIAYTFVGGGPVWICREFSRLVGYRGGEGHHSRGASPCRPHRKTS